MKQTMIILFILLISMSVGLYADYTVNFEGTNETKTGYASGTVTLSGLDWNMTESLIGTLANDWKNGVRSARMRGHATSSMTMLANKSGGMGTVTFYYRRYGTEAQVDWKVEYSTDNGSNWTQIGSSFTAPASDIVQTFSETVNVTGDVRLRIKRATETGTTDRRLNIDDITITDYSGGTPMCATPVIDPAGGYKYSSFNATITCDTEDAVIYYTTDGSDPDDTSTEYVGPVAISSTTTLKAIAYADGYDPSAVATATYTFPITVANIAALRAGTVGSTLYYLSGEAILTFQYSGSNYKHYYIQDDTAAILVYDASPYVISTGYNQYDGITGIYGTLALYNGLLEFIPTLNTSAASSTGNTVTPEVKTIASITSSDQSKLIRINGVTFSSTGNFANSTDYPISDASKAIGNMRTSFSNVDYIGTPIPTTDGDLICLVGWYNAAQVTPRDLNDFIDFEAVPVIIVSTETLSGFTYVYGNGPSAEQIFTVSGTDLTGNIVITPPDNYEISEGTDAKAFEATNPITLTPTDGVVGETTIYVRLKENLAIGTYNDEEIDVSSSDATSKTVTCSGTVSTPPPPGAPTVLDPTDIGPDSFTANWQAVSGATGYYLDVYTLLTGATTLSEGFEGYSTSNPPDGWSLSTTGSGSYILTNVSNSHTGTNFAGIRDLNGWIQTKQYLNPTDISFWGKASGTTSNYTVVVQTSPDGTKAWTDHLTIVANGSNSGDVTTTYAEYSANLNLTGNYYIRWYMSARTGGTFYFDDVTINYTGLTKTYALEDYDVGDVTSYPVTGLQPNTMYYYVVRAYNNYGTSGDSDEMPLPGDGTVPVELSSFTAVVTSENFVALHWTTQSETNVQGYYIYRNTFNELNSAYRIPALIGATNTSQEANYTFIDEEVLPNNTYYYWLQNLDMDGSFGFHGPINVTILQGDGGDTPPVIPTRTELLAAYPNPFNPVTHLRYSLKTPGFVTIDVYNNRGQLIRSFSNDHPAAGYYQMTWDGRDMNGRSVSSGIYYYRMTSGKYTSSKKVVLLK